MVYDMRPFIVLGFISLLIFPSGFEGKRYPRTLNATASEAARPYFDQGLLLLHNFEYVDAAEQFVLAQQKDPGFVLSYWGEAMTYDHPVWRNGNLDKSRAALEKIGATDAERSDRAKTALEKDLMAGAGILFGEGSKIDRERAYAEHMAELYVKYPANRDVAAFYALSLLATKDDWTQWEDNNVQAAEVAHSILEADPDHPGALHYLIHADDHPLYASRGLAAADRYAKVASYAGHALHMPSHIYLALGMWDEVVNSNEVSWQAGVDRKQKKALNNDALNYHAHWWLAYGYLQQGRFGRTKELIDNQVSFVNELPSGVAYFHLLQMKGPYLFNTDDWKGGVANIHIDERKLDDGDWYTHNFLEGYHLFKRGKSAELANLIKTIDARMIKSRQLQNASQDVAVCGLPESRPEEVKAARRYMSELKGLHAWLERDPVAAESHLKESLPPKGSVVIGPPKFLISPHEIYGHFLMEHDRPREALQQFEKALAASPNRYIGLKGKLAAARMLKDTDLERSTLEQLDRNLKSADQAARKDIW